MYHFDESIIKPFVRECIGKTDKVIDADTNQPVNWKKVETILAQSDGHLVNLHLSPSTTDFPDIPLNTTDLKTLFSFNS